MKNIYQKNEIKKTAIVRYIGNQERVRLSCEKTDYRYCRDCEQNNCDRSAFKSYQFIYGQLYNAYFLEYWQGERRSLHVKGSDNLIDDFNDIEDFEIIEDIDNVLNTNDATVRCITHKYENLERLRFGITYKAIGLNKSGLILVMDESSDCYFYPRDAFEIIEDKHGILDATISSPIYDWGRTHKDSINTFE